MPPPDYLNLPINLTPLQQRTAIATPGVGAGGGLYRSPEAFDYYSSLLENQLIDAQGNVINENLRQSLQPVERQFLTNQLGFEPGTTSELFQALGIDTTQPITQEQVNNAFRNAFTPGRREQFGEGGDRSPGGPQTGAGRVAAVSSPNLGEVGAGQGLAAGLGALNPGLGALAGLGAMGLGAAGAFGGLGDFGVVGGPNRPQMTTTADKIGFREAQRGPASAGGAGALGAEAGIGGSSHSRAREFGGRQRDRDREGDHMGSGPSRGGGDPHGGGFAYGGLIGREEYSDPITGYATGGMINRINGYATGGEIMPNQDPTFTPGPKNAGFDDVSITAQTGEYVINRPAVEMFGPEFFDILNDMAMRNPGLEPKEVLKAASSMLPKSETMTSKAQPGDVANRINSAIGQGSFATGGLIGTAPPKL